jgi:hypothetical protein
MREWFEDHFGFLVGVGIGMICICTLALLMVRIHDEEMRWKQYSDAHHCQVKGVKRGQMEPVLGGRGGVTMGEDQTIYVCDDGEIVIR